MDIFCLIHAIYIETPNIILYIGNNNIIFKIVYISNKYFRKMIDFCIRK
jgi:hypothetical protein